MALGLTTEEVEDLFAVGAGQGEFGAVVEHDDVFTVEPGAEFLDAVGVDNCRAVDAEEAAGVEALLDRGHGFANEVGFAADVEGDIVVGGFDPVDFVLTDEEHAAGGFDSKTGGFLVALFEFVEKLENAGVALRGGGLAADAVEGFFEACGVEGLEEIVDGVDFEGTEGELVVSGDEDDGGDGCWGEALEEVEAGETGHLDVEKQDIGGLGGEVAEGFFGGFELSVDGEVGSLGEHAAEALAGEAFVVNDECVKWRHGSVTGNCGGQV